MKGVIQSILILAFASSASVAAPPMQIYVTPYYDARGPMIRVGKFSGALMQADKSSIGKVTRAMQAESESLSVAAVYVAAIRLYDLGHRDDAVRWFYAAQYRAKLLQALSGGAGGMGSAAAELNSAHTAFQRLAGPDINGHAGCNRAKWLAAIAAAGEQAMPEFRRIYPSLQLPPKSSWAQTNASVHRGLETFSRSLKKNWSALQRQRRKNGMDDRYCAPTDGRGTNPANPD